MAVREGGVYRREKGGTEKRVSGPTSDQALGAHAKHPSKQAAAAKASDPAQAGATSAAKSTGVKEQGDAKSSAGA